MRRGVGHNMTPPTNEQFFSEARQAFAYLLPAGFATPDTVERPTGAEIRFAGKNAAVELSLDRRDSCIDCYVARVTSGMLTKNDKPGGYWAHLHQFLIQRRRYRGAFKEFSEDLDSSTWQSVIARYARALKALAPEVASDEPGCLEAK